MAPLPALHVVGTLAGPPATGFPRRAARERGAPEPATPQPPCARAAAGGRASFEAHVGRGPEPGRRPPLPRNDARES